MGQDDALDPPGLTKTQNSYFKAYLNSEVPSTLLTHDVLLDMGQGSLKAYFNRNDSHLDRSQQISRIWRDLLSTTRSIAVTDRHLTAACNAMGVFLECACASTRPDVRDFGMSRETWLQCFDAILESFEEGKVKPMRQVLITLANILTRHPDHSVSSSIQKEVMVKMTDMVLFGEAGQMKAALFAMELFIRRVASFDDVLKSIEYCVNGRRVEWSYRLASFGIKRVVEELPVPASISGVPADEAEFRTTIALFVALLIALLSRDTQSAAIALLKTYSTALTGSGRGDHLYSMSTSSQEEKSEVGINDDFKGRDQSPWIALIQKFLGVHPVAVTPFTDFLFPAILKRDPGGYRKYVDSLQKGNCSLINLLAIVQVGYHVGLDCDPALNLTRVIQGVDGRPGQAYEIYGKLLSHTEAGVRIRTFALLLASSSTTAPLSSPVLQCLKSNMKYLYGDSDPQSRSEVISIARKLMIRLQGGAYSLHKSMINPPSRAIGEDADNSFTDLHSHENFLVWYAKFLQDELMPNASYQRHIMALKSLDILVRSGLDSVITTRMSAGISLNETSWPIHVSLHQPSLTSALINLVMDPFEDVRIAASMLLEILASAAVLPMQKSIGELVRRAEELASNTGRADHADGTARLYKLYYTLLPNSSLLSVASALPSKRAVIEEILTPTEKALEGIEGDLDVPLHQISLHARLLGLSYLLQDRNFPGDDYEDETSKSLHRESLISRTVCLCEQVWRKVHTRLCVDSPENADSDVSEDVLVKPKDILSYSWRALRDSSVLGCAILDSPIFQERGALSHLSLKCLESIGLLCMDQLSTLRHRGAFSTVSRTFSALCGRIGELHDHSVSRLRDVWYENAVATIDQQATRLTRRSAGLPAMMVGLLNGCTQAFFDRFMETFQKKAKIPINFSDLLSENGNQQIELPQVHALNCLREVFINARFRMSTEPHVMDMLNLAATSLSCNVWAIRNCGLMLFRACTSRLRRARTSLLTGQDASQSWTSEVIVSNDKAVDVLNLAINLLDSGYFSQRRSEISATLKSGHDPITGLNETTTPLATERIFAALDLIGRISPLVHGTDYIERLLLGMLSSKVWQVRERAARVLASRVSHWEIFDLLCRLVDGISAQQDQNMIHGRLLCVKHILHTLWRSREEPLLHHLGRAAAMLDPLVAPLMAEDMSRVIRTTFLDIMNDAFEMDILSRSLGDSTVSTFWVGEYICGSTDLSDGTNFPKHESAAVNEAYHFFSSQFEPIQDPRSSSKLRDLFFNLAKVDFDAAARFLMRIASGNSQNLNVRNVLDDLYQFIIANEIFPEDLRFEAMTRFTVSLERRPICPEPSESLLRISQCFLCHSEPQGRDLRNAKLRLQAKLLTLGSHAQVCAEGQCHLSLWIAMLQDAARDDIDTPTRLNAASSLLSLTPFLLSDQPASVHPSQYLQIYLILYDLLNDDDEDVRDIAASAASNVLDTEQTVSRTQVKLCPLAASEKLASFLAAKFRREPYLTVATLRRVWFSSSVGVKRDFFEQGVEHCSVKDLLEDLQQDSEALFEEERQNLYVDDVREVEIWSRILGSTESPEEGHLNSLGDWTLAALRDLRDYLNDKADSGGPLGLTSQPDTLILFVRVIKLAGVVLAWVSRQSDQVQGTRLAGASDITLPLVPTNVRLDPDEASPTSRWKTGMLVELNVLGALGRRLCIHERIMRSIEEAIKEH